MANVHELAAVRMKTRTINSFAEYVIYTEKYKGQSDAAWDITPSSFRLGKPSTLDFERKAIAITQDYLHSLYKVEYQLPLFGNIYALNENRPR